MQLSKGQVEVTLSEGAANPSPQSLAIPPTSRRMEDPEARQSRKLALMAALSEGLPTLPAYVFELNSLLAAVR